MKRSDQILDFWFGNDPQNPLKNSATWWKKDPAFDEEVRNRFETDLVQALQRRYDTWKDKPRECLAWIILLDQFSRNLYRDGPQAFAQDALALAACQEGMVKKLDAQLHPIERSFFLHTHDALRGFKGAAPMPRDLSWSGPGLPQGMAGTPQE